MEFSGLPHIKVGLSLPFYFCSEDVMKGVNGVGSLLCAFPGLSGVNLLAGSLPVSLGENFHSLHTDAVGLLVLSPGCFPRSDCCLF